MSIKDLSEILSKGWKKLDSDSKKKILNKCNIDKDKVNQVLKGDTIHFSN
jgi:hypothetical protein